ncbi:MAG: DUF4892 domain-containing protein [Cellvibrio sp.]
MLGFYLGRLTWLSFIFVLGVLALWAHAQDKSENLVQYPEAKILKISESVDSDYLLATGVYVKVGGVWRNTSIERLKGDVSRATLELPSTDTYLMGYEFYRKQLDERSATVIYECEKRDCGTSNSWANNHFKVYQLYGLDQFQKYGVYQHEVNEQKLITVLYAVRRGNGRAYMQVEQLLLKSE